MLTQTSNLIAETSAQLEELQSQQSKSKASEKLQDILEWLSPLEPSSQQNTASSLRDPDTCEWFFERPEFLKWRDGDEQVLFCHGMPGSGKTVLTSAVIHRFHETARLESACVTYFFCHHQLYPELELQEILLCLVKQIVRQCPDLPLVVESMFDLYQNVQFKPSMSDASVLLESALTCFRKTYIFVDAVDEFMSREHSLDDGVQILEFLTGNVIGSGAKLYFTSRLAPKYYVWNGAALKLQTIEIRAPESDVSLFLRRRENRFPKFVHGKAELLKQIEDVVTEKASGQFLMVRLFYQHLVSKRRLPSLRKALDDLSHSVPIYSDVYDLTLRRIQSMDEDICDLAKRALSLLSRVLSPITPSALLAAIALEPGRSSFDPENIPDLDELMAICLGLITVGDEYISFSHETGRAYVRSAGADWTPPPDDCIARCCLACLSLQLDQSVVDKDGIVLADLLFDFYHYAAINWTTHVRDAFHDIKSDTSTLTVAIKDFLDDPKRRLSYLRHVESVQGDMNLGDLEAIGPSHVVAYYGLTAAMPIIYRDEGERDFRTSKGQTPADIASHRNHRDTLAWLEDSNTFRTVKGTTVSPNIFRRATGSRTSTHWMSRKSPSVAHIEARQLVHAVENLDKDAVENWVRYDFGPRTSRHPLQHALTFSCSLSNYQNSAVEVASLLLEHKSNPYGRSADERTPLSYASESGMESGVVELLLRSESDVIKHDAGAKGRSSLSYAASNLACGSKIASLLILHGANANSADTKGWTPMHYAAANSVQGSSISRILHDAGASIHCRDSDGRSPILCSVVHSDVDIVTTLLELGALINDTDNAGRTPLLYAASNEEFGYRVVNKLVQSGADVSKVDRMGNCVVAEFSRHSATQTHLCQTLETLKDAGAPLDLENVHGRTPLSVAAEVGTEECLEWLLGQDVRVDARSVGGRTPLSWAAAGGNIMAASLLLDAGAELDTRYEFGLTPLMHAAFYGSLSVLSFLIDRGANIECSTTAGMTALLLAVTTGQFECADLLLRSGAAADVFDRQGKTAMQHAWEKGHVDIYELLKVHLSTRQDA